MRNDFEAADEAAPPPPPMPMPTAHSAQVVAENTGQGGWDVDPDRLREFADAVELVRQRLADVEAKVDRMRSAAYTPKLGTSPVGVQLERKFTDRLDAPLDHPEHPTRGGLRPMLAESMRRMNAFVADAEAAARQYRELDESAAQHLSTAELASDRRKS